MDLKIFKAGQFTEKEYNEFQNTHVIGNYKIAENGDIYVYYREIDDIHVRPITKIETIHEIIRKHEGDIFVAQKDEIKHEATIAKLKEEITPFHDKQKEYKDIQTKIEHIELQMKADKDTISEKNKEITDLVAQMNVIKTEISKK